MGRPLTRTEGGMEKGPESRTTFLGGFGVCMCVEGVAWRPRRVKTKMNEEDGEELTCLGRRQRSGLWGPLHPVPCLPQALVRNVTFLKNPGLWRGVFQAGCVCLVGLPLSGRVNEDKDQKQLSR